MIFISRCSLLSCHGDNTGVITWPQYGTLVIGTGRDRNPCLYSKWSPTLDVNGLHDLSAGTHWPSLVNHWQLATQFCFFLWNSQTVDDLICFWRLQKKLIKNILPKALFLFLLDLLNSTTYHFLRKHVWFASTVGLNPYNPLFYLFCFLFLHSSNVLQFICACMDKLT